MAKGYVQRVVELVCGFGMRERGEKGDKSETIVRPGTKTACSGRVGAVLGWFGIGLAVVVGSTLGAWCVGAWVRAAQKQWSRSGVG